MELIYAKGQLSSDGTQVGLYDPDSDRLEVVAWISPYIGEHMNGTNSAIDAAQRGIERGLSFDEIVKRCQTMHDMWNR